MAKELEEVILLAGELERKLFLGSDLNLVLRLKFIDFLKANIYCFTWSHLDITNIMSDLVTHKLSFDPVHPYVK